MKHKSLLLAALLAAGLTFAFAGEPAHAAAEPVTVTLPKFPVELDGVQLDNAHLKYPLLTYKDITYIPMTWSIAQATALQLQWSEENGLTVYLGTPMSVKPELEAGGSFRDDRYTAQVAEFPVTVNQTAVNNAEQAYPLLVFQNVTYFPLTWDYAVDTFRWKLTWDEADGLSIKTIQRRYMAGIVYEDEDSLYTYINNVRDRMFRIPKSLEGSPELLTVEQSKHITDILQSSSRNVPDEAEAKPKLTMYRDHRIWYNDIPLISVEQEEASRRLAWPDAEMNSGQLWYQEQVFELAEDTRVFSFTIQTGPSNPGGTPSSKRLVIAHQGNVQELADFTRGISGVRQSNEGVWLWTNSPTRLSARTGSDRGEVLWVNAADGTYRFWNQMLDAQYVRVLHHEDDKLLVQAYELYRLANASPKTTGYFWLHSDGTYEKIGNLTEETIVPDALLLIADNLDAYVDRDHTIYVSIRSAT
ncbi:MAG: hypothetical protein K0Q59_4283 [Paenibacillus sp.]|nr:hypothetical protein [Paenibacillus sp.]